MGGFVAATARAEQHRMENARTRPDAEFIEGSIDLIDYFDPRNRNLSLLCIATRPI
tara:strand:- start:350 stop:517 length:168 start_codon:yes stop_codon:yes gene_type:complete